VTDQVRARQAIEESQKQFKILSEAIPQLVWTATPAGAITYCNPQWYAYTGLSEEQSLGQGWTSAFHPEDLPHLLEHWQQALQTGQSYQTEARLKSGEGSYRWFLLRALPLPDEQGSIKQWFGTDTDIHDRKLAEETLRESEAQFRLMADAVPQIVWLTDWEGRVEFFNKQWTRYTGAAYEPTTAAQVAASFVHPQEGQLTMEAFAQARRTGSIFSVEHRIRSAEGNYRWFLVRAEPYRDPNTGEILRWFGASIDIHDQKLAQQALQESEERFRIMADAAPNIVWALHPDGTQKYLNKFGLQYLGVTLQEALALNWTPFIHPEDLAATSQAVSGAIEHQRPYRQEHRLRRHDGGYRWYLAQGAPSYYPSGELYGYVGSGIDITDLKEAEQRLQLLSEELAAANEELRASNQELLQANECLSRVNADLDNFIYTASHDLKAPILNIEGLLKVLSRKVQAQSGQEEQLSHILTLMENSVSRFKETISDLTDIARIQKQLDVASEPVNLREMIEITLLDLTQVIEEAGARIENHLEESHTVMFPRKNLKSVLYNLLSNAVKYRDPDRALLIRIFCRTEGDYFILNVQDNGLGMDTRDPDKIFGMFKRQHAHVEGTGIGLYIVKKMVENAGGMIEVESHIGVGSTFGVYFKLP
jgi:PAS domain S-box-containing protein